MTDSAASPTDRKYTAADYVAMAACVIMALASMLYVHYQTEKAARLPATAVEQPQTLEE